MTDAHPELAAEQAHVDRAHRRLNQAREDALRLKDMVEVGQGGTNQARWEREVINENIAARLRQLDLGERSLCFGRIDQSEEAGGGSYHIGRIGVSSETQEPLVVDWRAPVAEAFYRATGRDPQGLVREGALRCIGALGRPESVPVLAAAVREETDEFLRVDFAAVLLALESDAGRETLLERLLAFVGEEGWFPRLDPGWAPKDVRFYGDQWCKADLVTVTENHGGERRLTRLRLELKPTLFQNALLLLLGYLLILVWAWNPSALLALMPVLVGVGWQFGSSRRRLRRTIMASLLATAERLALWTDRGPTRRLRPRRRASRPEGRCGGRRNWCRSSRSMGSGPRSRVSLPSGWAAGVAERWRAGVLPDRRQLP